MSSWECTYCGHKQLENEKNVTYLDQPLHIGETDVGAIGVVIAAHRCLNTECNKLTLRVGYGKNVYSRNTGRFETDHAYYFWNLLPTSSAKPQPDYIPEPIRQDYYEACKIKDDSPKASATLARRCLQGMIRDFCGISKKQLIHEITALEAQLADGSAPRGVDEETIAAITAVRKIGNIGAHMEMDINVIVDVDPEEAQILIELIEMLFVDWYVARDKRQKRLANIQAITDTKEQQKQLAFAVPTQPETASTTKLGGE